MRLIDADKLLGLFIESGQKHGSEHGCKLGENWLLDYNDIKAVIDNAPTIKPTTVYEFKGCPNCELERPKGKWVDTGRTWEETVDGFIRYGNVYECSACKAEVIECTPFCGYCGARMER